MREHQIVINLKPDQFEELQRMARAAGSKSVNLFVRQKLIATLGLGNPGNGVEENDGPDLKHLTGELRRLHRELQIFVADSLSNSDYTMASIEPIPFPTAVQENFLAEGAPLMPESVGFTYFQEPMSHGVTLQATDLQAPSATPQAGGLQPAYAVPPDPNSQDISAPANAQPAYSIPEAPPEPTNATARNAGPQIPDAQNAVLQNPISQGPVAQNPTAQSPTSQTPVSVKGFADHDELEDLAERAFAISPRLGQLDEAAKRFPDPLKDLLEDALLNGMDDADEELENEAPTDSESKDQIEVGADVSSEADAAQNEQEQTNPEAQSSDLEPSDGEHYETEESEFSSDRETIEEGSEYSSEVPETSTGTDDEPPQDDTPTDPPPQFPPPISGGPPPRKRRT